MGQKEISCSSAEELSHYTLPGCESRSVGYYRSKEQVLFLVSDEHSRTWLTSVGLESQNH